ncbi:MAG: TSUP family transporter, partial [Bacteroidia bacterium]
MTISTTTPKFRYFTPALFILTALWLVIYIGFFPEPAALAARNWPLILVGVAGAMIGNITAIGGGLVFIPVLMFVYHTDPLSALKLAFVSQAVGMTSGASGWLKRREVPLHLLKWTIPSLIVGTLIATFLLHPSGMVVKSLFGPVSLIAGVLTLVTLNRV